MKGCLVIERLKHSCNHSANNFAENRFSLTKTTQLWAGAGVGWGGLGVGWGGVITLRCMKGYLVIERLKDSCKH